MSRAERGVAERGQVDVTANDQTRMNQGGDPESSFAPAAFTLTRTWAALKPAKPVPGGPLTVRVRGLADTARQPLYLHLRRGSKSLKVTRLGVLVGRCDAASIVFRCNRADLSMNVAGCCCGRGGSSLAG